MAILHSRVDERLIHGQVAIVWTNTIGAGRIAVVNDEAVADEMLIAALKISKPAGVKLSILSKAKAVEKFKAGFYDEDKIFLITKNIDDMVYLINEGIDIKSFNVGNVAKRDGSRAVKKSVNLTDNDIKIINSVIEKGVKVTAQMLPSESDQSITTFLS